MKKRNFLYLVALLISTCKLSQANGQNISNANVVANVSIGAVLALTMTDNTSNNFNYTTASQIANGITTSNFSNFQVKSNVPWMLNAASATTFFSASGIYSSSNMPASVLALSVTSKPAISLTTSPQTLTTGNRGNAATTGNSFSTNIKATPTFNYGPGVYTITINYTLTAQ